eukprot:TRINITY_DN2179_c0_g2_i1.p1 TRINITY_DN2179_c0_g2~~TRINITY_DN2179_c0_g2_i1.p1  ORF type:complete len:187 (-),score=14.72 TRINITY_DN2179_c0_g2_i1:18-578(-)
MEHELVPLLQKKELQEVLLNQEKHGKLIEMFHSHLYRAYDLKIRKLLKRGNVEVVKVLGEKGKLGLVFSISHVNETIFLLPYACVHYEHYKSLVEDAHEHQYKLNIVVLPKPTEEESRYFVTKIDRKYQATSTSQQQEDEDDEDDEDDFDLNDSDLKLCNNCFLLVKPKPVANSMRCPTCNKNLGQ